MSSPTWKKTEDGILKVDILKVLLEVGEPPDDTGTLSDPIKTRNLHYHATDVSSQTQIF